MRIRVSGKVPGRKLRTIASVVCIFAVLLPLAGKAGGTLPPLCLAQEADIAGGNGEQMVKADGSVIDFSYYKGVNVDVYAWIYYPGTGVIDYPVLQSIGDQEFYLHHDWTGAESYPGSIFSQIYNKRNFTDFLTVLYGHNMKDTSMFGSLRQLEGSDIMWNYDTIYIYLPEVALKYRIFAVYVNDNSHLLYRFDQEDEEDCRNYLDSVERKSEGVSTFNRELFDTLTPDSHILVLSTCYRGDPEHRFLVQAVLDESGDAARWIAQQEEQEEKQKQAARENAWEGLVEEFKSGGAHLKEAWEEQFGEDTIAPGE